MSYAETRATAHTDSELLALYDQIPTMRAEVERKRQAMPAWEGIDPPDTDEFRAIRGELCSASEQLEEAMDAIFSSQSISPAVLDIKLAMFAKADERLSAKPEPYPAPASSYNGMAASIARQVQLMRA